MEENNKKQKSLKEKVINFVYKNLLEIFFFVTIIWFVIFLLCLINYKYVIFFIFILVILIEVYFLWKKYYFEERNKVDSYFINSWKDE